MPDLGGLPLGISVALFVAAGLVIVAAGTRLAGVADVLADRTGLGEAVVGATLLAATTSIGGMITSLTAAHAGQADLAVSNAVGGIAVQTVFPVFAVLGVRLVADLLFGPKSGAVEKAWQPMDGQSSIANRFGE